VIKMGDEKKKECFNIRIISVTELNHEVEAEDELEAKELAEQWRRDLETRVYIDRIQIDKKGEEKPVTLGDLLKKTNTNKTIIYPFENYTPLDLLVHVYRFYQMQQDDDHYFSDGFINLMANVALYLRSYQPEKKHWQHVTPETEAEIPIPCYRRIYEDETIIVHLTATVLRVITKSDSSAVDIPLKMIKGVTFE